MFEGNGSDSHPPGKGSPSENGQSSSSVLEELERKYFSNEEVDSSIAMHRVPTPGTSPSKMSDEKAPRLVVLDGRFIDRIGDLPKFNAIGTNIYELDLSYNKLSCWKEIGELMKLPELRIFSIGHNPLERTISVTLPTSKLLKTLVLNATNIPFSTIRTLLSSMPMLVELHLSDNSIEKLFDDGCEAISKTVKLIHASRCEISRWDSVVRLMQLFPSCKSMFVCENPLNFGLKTDDVEKLSGIEELNVNNTHVDHWELFEMLGKLRSLHSIRALLIPLMNQYNLDERTNLLMCRMPHVQCLNGGTVSDEERERAERFFLRYYDAHEVKPPAYASLLAKHGRLEQLCVVDLSPKTHVNVTVVCEDTGVRTAMQIRLSATIGAFLRCLEKRTGIPVHSMRVFYMGQPGLNGCPHELRNPSQHISALRPEDGDYFTVQSKAVTTGCKKVSPRK